MDKITHNESPESKTASTVIYLGEQYIQSPTELIADSRLSALDTRAWQHMRMLAYKPGDTQLIQGSVLNVLTQTLGKTRQTIAASLEVLRALRWVGKGVRHRENGQFAHNPWTVFGQRADLQTMLSHDPLYLLFLIEKSRRLPVEQRLARITHEVIRNEYDEIIARLNDQSLLLSLNDKDRLSYNQKLRDLITAHHVKFFNDCLRSSSYLYKTTTTVRAHETMLLLEPPKNKAEPIKPVDFTGVSESYRVVIDNVLRNKAFDLTDKNKNDIARAVVERCLDTTASPIRHLPAYVSKLIENCRGGVLDLPWERSKIIEQEHAGKKVIEKQDIEKQLTHSKMEGEELMRRAGAYQDDDDNWLFPKNKFKKCPYKAIDNGDGNWIIKKVVK